MAALWRKAVSGFVDRRLINRDFARLWYGQAVSGLGDYVFNTTLTLWIAVKIGAGKPWAPAAVGGLLIAATVAVVVVGPIAGVWVDRWDRRRTMLRTESVRASLAGALAVVSLLPEHDLPVGVWLAVVYALVFALNAAGRFFGPAQLVTISRVVPGVGEQTRAFGIVNATAAATRMIGPPLAAPLLFASGVTWALALNAASYVVSYLAIRSLELPQVGGGVPQAEASGGARSFRGDFIEGLRFFTRSKVVFGVLVWCMLCQVGIGALNTLDVFFVTGNLRVPAEDFGFMAVGMGAGLILGSLLAPRLVRKLGPATTTTAVLLSAGLIYMLYARQTTFAAGLALLMLFEIPVAVVGTSMDPILLAAIPQRLYARVMSAFGTLNQGTNMLFMAVWGSLASTAMRGFHSDVLGVHVGPIDSILTLAGSAIFMGGVVSKATLPSDAVLDRLSTAQTSGPDPDPGPATAAETG
jgi:MFS family permease